MNSPRNLLRSGDRAMRKPLHRARVPRVGGRNDWSVQDGDEWLPLALPRPRAGGSSACTAKRSPATRAPHLSSSRPRVRGDGKRKGGHRGASISWPGAASPDAGSGESKTASRRARSPPIEPALHRWKHDWPATKGHATDRARLNRARLGRSTTGQLRIAGKARLMSPD